MKKLLLFAGLVTIASAQTVVQQNLDAASYRFTRTNGLSASGNLSSAGSGKVITLTNMPFGMAIGSYVYISAGTGTPEAVPITAVSGSPRDATGTITVTTANTHTGAWAVTSATAGIQEAIYSLQSGIGGIISVPWGTSTIYAPIKRRLLMPVWIRGQGMEATILAVAATFPNSVANGVLDWSPGDARAVTEGGGSSFAVKFIQPDSTNVATYTHWKPAIYTSGTYHTQWQDIEIIGAWDIATIPTNTNGADFFNIRGSFFNRGISVDQSFDSVRIDSFHTTTTGLTVNQATAFLAFSTANVTFYMGRADDLKLTDCTSGTRFFADFHSGSDGLGSAVEIIGGWSEGRISISNGNVRITNMHLAGGGTSPLISQIGGILNLSQVGILYVGSNSAIVSAIEDDSSSAAGTYPPMFVMNNSRLDLQGFDNVGLAGSTASPFVDRMDYILSGNYFYRTPAGTYTTAVVNITKGTGNPRLTMTGNRFETLGGGTGTGVIVSADTDHIVTGNDGGGYGFTLPATVANIRWNGNNTFLGNVDYPAKSTFANLGTPANGAIVYCSNCTIASPCAGAGTGALAKRLNGAWVCN